VSGQPTSDRCRVTVRLELQPGVIGELVVVKVMDRYDDWRAAGIEITEVTLELPARR
jgi:hypothetical protein